MMAAAAAMKKQNNLSQKDDGGAPSGSIAAIAVATLPEKQNNKFEPIIKTNNRECVPPAGDVAPMTAAVVALQKQNTRSEKGEGSAPIIIALMVAAVVLKKYRIKLNHQ